MGTVLKPDFYFKTGALARQIIKVGKFFIQISDITCQYRYPKNTRKLSYKINIRPDLVVAAFLSRELRTTGNGIKFQLGLEHLIKNLLDVQPDHTCSSLGQALMVPKTSPTRPHSVLFVVTRVSTVILLWHKQHCLYYFCSLDS